jgi:hypothetical protein
MKTTTTEEEEEEEDPHYEGRGVLLAPCRRTM